MRKYLAKPILSSISIIDELISKASILAWKEKKSLITFLFHGIFKDASEIKRNIVDPQQGITVALLRQFIEYYLQNNYHFVTPNDIINGLSDNKNHVLITFDDGYFNNNLSLQVFREYNIPAIYFISANHIIENKCFWWDIVYRERIKKCASVDIIYKEVLALKNFKNNQIEEYIIKNFGINSFKPKCDIDRPFSPSELKSFSNDSLVFIGNHTNNHAILTNYTSDEVKDEIVGCQVSISKMIGITPETIAYPNGNYSSQILNIVRDTGIKLGITVDQGKNLLPLDMYGNNSLLLKRFVLWGNKNINKQCSYFRSDFHLKNTLYNMINKKK